MLCPAAMNHATTLRIMERLIADEFRYEVNMGHPLPLGAPDSGLRSIVWKRRVHRRSSDGERSQVCLSAAVKKTAWHPAATTVRNFLPRTLPQGSVASKNHKKMQAMLCCRHDISRCHR